MTTTKTRLAAELRAVAASILAQRTGGLSSLFWTHFPKPPPSAQRRPPHEAKEAGNG